MYSIEDFIDGKGREVWSVREDAPVLDALRIMAEKQCGALIVLDKSEKMTGVISERDYARKVVLMSKTSIDTPVSEIMSTDVVVVKSDDSLDDALSLMSKHNIRHLPVMENGELIGVVGIGELVLYKIEEAERKIQNKDKEVQQLTKYVNGSLSYR